MEASERFEILNKFLGWGNPENAIWFVGIEEASDWSKRAYDDKNKRELTLKEYEERIDEDIIKDYKVKNGIKQCEVINEPGKLYSLIKNILTDEKLKDTLIENVFVSNLYPLGVNNTKPETWNKVYSEYKNAFGLLDDEIIKDNYYKRVASDRFDLLSKLHDKYKPKLTVCYGTNNSLDFSKCFNVKLYEHPYPDKFAYFLSEDESLIVVNHFSYYAYLFKNNHLDLIKEKYKTRES